MIASRVSQTCDGIAHCAAVAARSQPSSAARRQASWSAARRPAGRRDERRAHRVGTRLDDGDHRYPRHLLARRRGWWRWRSDGGRSRRRGSRPGPPTFHAPLDVAELADAAAPGWASRRHGAAGWRGRWRRCAGRSAATSPWTMPSNSTSKREPSSASRRACHWPPSPVVCTWSSSPSRVRAPGSRRSGE